MKITTTQNETTGNLRSITIEASDPVDQAMLTVLAQEVRERYSLCPTLTETLDFIQQKGEARAKDIADALGITLTAANQRASRLMELHLIDRYRETHASGGIVYVYRPMN